MHAKYRAILALAVAGGLMGALASPATAAPSAVAANGHSYEVVTASVNWTVAEATARTMSWGVGGYCSGYLATVTSQAENDFLASSFGSALDTKWFGGIQPVSSMLADGWTWANGETWSFTNWDPIEPNNGYYGTTHGYEDATVFWTAARWNDSPRSWVYGGSGGFVVEYDCQGVAVDVKPGSSENTVNGNDHGVIPLAILTTATFDAATVDPMTVTMNGAAAKVRGKSQTAGALEDVDGDGDLDLVVQIVDSDGYFVGGSSTASITAMTYDGVQIKGFDTITYVP